MSEFDGLISAICNPGSNVADRSEAERRLLDLLSQPQNLASYLPYLASANDTVVFFLGIGLQRLIWPFWPRLDIGQQEVLLDSIQRVLRERPQLAAFAQAKLSQVLAVICIHRLSLQPVLAIVVPSDQPGSLTGLQAIKTVLDSILSDDHKIDAQSRQRLVLEAESILTPLTHLACTTCLPALQIGFNEENFLAMKTALDVLKVITSKLQLGPHISMDVLALLFSVAEVGLDSTRANEAMQESAMSAIEVLTEVMSKRFIPASSTSNGASRQDQGAAVLLTLVSKTVQLLKRCREAADLAEEPLVPALLDFLFVFSEAHLERCLLHALQQHHQQQQQSTPSAVQEIAVFFDEVSALTLASQDVQILGRLLELWVSLCACVTSVATQQDDVQLRGHGQVDVLSLLVSRRHALIAHVLEGTSLQPQLRSTTSNSPSSSSGTHLREEIDELVIALSASLSAKNDASSSSSSSANGGASSSSNASVSAGSFVSMTIDERIEAMLRRSLAGSSATTLSSSRSSGNTSSSGANTTSQTDEGGSASSTITATSFLDTATQLFTTLLCLPISSSSSTQDGTLAWLQGLWPTLLSDYSTRLQTMLTSVSTSILTRGKAEQTLGLALGLKFLLHLAPLILLYPTPSREGENEVEDNSLGLATQILGLLHQTLGIYAELQSAWLSSSSSAANSTSPLASLLTAVAALQITCVQVAATCLQSPRLLPRHQQQLQGLLQQQLLQQQGQGQQQVIDISPITAQAEMYLGSLSSLATSLLASFSTTHITSQRTNDNNSNSKHINRQQRVLLRPLLVLWLQSLHVLAPLLDPTHQQLPQQLQAQGLGVSVYCISPLRDKVCEASLVLLQYTSAHLENFSSNSSLSGSLNPLARDADAEVLEEVHALCLCAQDALASGANQTSVSQEPSSPLLESATQHWTTQFSAASQLLQQTLAHTSSHSTSTYESCIHIQQLPFVSLQRLLNALCMLCEQLALFKPSNNASGSHNSSHTNLHNAASSSSSSSSSYQRRQQIMTTLSTLQTEITPFLTTLLHLLVHLWTAIFTSTSPSPSLLQLRTGTLPALLRIVSHTIHLMHTLLRCVGKRIFGRVVGVDILSLLTTFVGHVCLPQPQIVSSYPPPSPASTSAISTSSTLFVLATHPQTPSQHSSDAQQGLSVHSGGSLPAHASGGIAFLLEILSLLQGVAQQSTSTSSLASTQIASAETLVEVYAQLASDQDYLCNELLQPILRSLLVVIQCFWSNSNFSNPSSASSTATSVVSTSVSSALVSTIGIKGARSKGQSALSAALAARFGQANSSNSNSHSNASNGRSAFGADGANNNSNNRLQQLHVPALFPSANISSTATPSTMPSASFLSSSSSSTAISSSSSNSIEGLVNRFLRLALPCLVGLGLSLQQQLQLQHERRQLQQHPSSSSSSASWSSSSVLAAVTTLEDAQVVLDGLLTLQHTHRLFDARWFHLPSDHNDRDNSSSASNTQSAYMYNHALASSALAAAATSGSSLARQWTSLLLRLYLQRSVAAVRFKLEIEVLLGDLFEAQLRCKREQGGVEGSVGMGGKADEDLCLVVANELVEIARAAASSSTATSPADAASSSFRSEVVSEGVHALLSPLVQRGDEALVQGSQLLSDFVQPVGALLARHT